MSAGASTGNQNAHGLSFVVYLEDQDPAHTMQKATVKQSKDAQWKNMERNDPEHRDAAGNTANVRGSA